MPPPTRWVVAVKHGIDVNLTRANPTTGRIDLAHAPRKTSDFDKNAVEEAVRLRAKHGGTVTAVTVGTSTAREALRDALSLGADQGVLLLAAEDSVMDSSAVATALAGYFQNPTCRFDLALFGEGSTDHFSGTVGPGVAAHLGLPSLCHVRQLTIEGEHLRVLRDLESGVEELETGLPAVVTVGQEINTPRTPTFLSTLKASKKDIQEIPISSLGLDGTTGPAPVTIQESFVPSMPRKRVRVAGGDAAEVSAALVMALREEGIDRR
ncbi:MAG: electron transfer flavoprotein subunit beta/FixA family protein [Thermoplasmata archaeon]